jgi:hypothetical protein
MEVKMSEIKHTPGPWQLKRFGAIFSSSGEYIVDLGISRRYVNPEANARLIAAAPDLLEALEGCLAQLERDTELLYEGMPHTEPEIIAIARTAIRKAKGE